ncbi:succinoglycan biosynthesis protein ExoW [Paucibacter oligotrophus]|uniref:Succinoglycan biosynthesis protein ExoW n=1 Tax=Roseateles oligotrophus TaxID=1769250 RepID=A0A840LD73_9BURK|nr:glycosyltransferase family 2 protein [Roseateles oligotrophus]MBB4844148.1 succinoglycan biosynthesis protein ExoW [Roseateles oligotrophus]
MNTSPKIAVIIPFFQRESGILERSLNSILAQGYPADAIYVLVVDDGSPIPAEQELANNPIAQQLRVRVIKQANAGPNEARNTGLAHLEPGTDLVAYLDSDDEWIGQHLQRAVLALGAGAGNAYFANLFHLGDTTNEFDKAKRVNHADHPPLNGDASLRVYQGDMVHQIATANIIFMPSLVISVADLGRARFPQAHRHGGGDYLYWMDLISHGARFVYSTEAEVRCGRGINMWYGSGWGTDGLAMRIVDEARFRRKVLQNYARAERTKTSLRARLAELQASMVQDVLHRLRARKPVNWQTVKLFFRENPPGGAMLGHLFGALKAKFGGAR